MLTFRGYIRVFCFIFFLGLAACVTTNDADFSDWNREQKELQTRFGADHAALIKKVRDARLTSPFVWEITKGDQTSWLLGSMHWSIDSGKMPLLIHQKYADARVFITEHQVGLDNPNGLQRPSDRSDPASKSLEDSLDPQAWQVLCHDLRLYSPQTLAHLSPYGAKVLYVWTKTSALIPALFQMDYELQTDARKSGKPIVDLDTRDGMLELSSQQRKGKATELSPSDLGLFLLNNPTKSVEKSAVKIYEVALFYMKGDLAAMERYVGDGEPELEAHSYKVRRWAIR